MSSASTTMRTFSDNRDPQIFPNGQKMDDRCVPEGVDASAIANRGALKATVKDIGSFFLLLPLAAARTMLHTMRQPIRKGNALILGSFIMLVMALYTSASVVAVVSDGIKLLSILCSMPVIPMLPLCGMIREVGRRALKEPFPELVEQQMGFVSLMNSASLNANLALDLKHTEMAVKDLNAEIKASDIKSKDLMVRSLSDIAAIAKQGNHQLIALQSGVGNAVDGILAMNEWALESLERSNPHSARSILEAVIFGTLPPRRTEITEKFNEIAGLMEAKLHRLVSMAQVTIVTLADLDSALDILQGVHLRAVKGTQLQKDQVLASMWTSVAQRREQLASYRRNFKLLSDVEKARSTAALKVSETLMQLLKLQEDLDNLRREVEPPQSHQAQPHIEVVVKTLRKGVERLSAARSAAQDTNWRSRNRMFSGPQHPEL